MAAATRASRAKAPDSVLANAVDVARAAAEAEAPSGSVGEHLGVEAETLDGVTPADRVATHLFACLDPGYTGWRWAVTVARASRARTATVDEVVLLPGPDSLLAPPWVPWSERARPGDLGVGVLLPTPADDPRLVPGYTGADDLMGLADRSPVSPSTWERGLGRVRVLSLEGRDRAARRWHDGDRGPGAPMARAVDVTCATCGFLVTIGGPLGQAFGICAHDMAPADGCVVALDYGCGAHSEVVDVGSVQSDPVRDDLGYDSLDLGDTLDLGHS